MDPAEQATIQLIAIVAVVVGMFGWLIKHVFNHYCRLIDRKDEYLKSLVDANQRNVENFVTTINHNQTKMNKAVDDLTQATNMQTKMLESQSKIFSSLIETLYGPRAPKI